MLQDKIYDYKLFRGNLLMEIFFPVVFNQSSMGITPGYVSPSDWCHSETGRKTCIKRAVFCVCYHEAKTGAEFCFLAVDLIWKDFCDLRGICRSNTPCSFCCTCSIFRVAICLCVGPFAYGFCIVAFQPSIWVANYTVVFCEKGGSLCCLLPVLICFLYQYFFSSYSGRLSDHILASYHCKS